MFLAASLSAQADGERRFELDPVLLLAHGQEQPGREDLTARFDRVTYRFASVENREHFLAEPRRWAVRLGGACARMGPLSGAGSQALWAVHDGGLYFFASTTCRSAFLSAPERFVPHDHEPPAASAEELARGEDLRQRLLAWAGGVERLARLREVRLRTERQVESEGEAVAVGELLVWNLERPHEWRRESWWGESLWWHARGGETAWIGTAMEAWEADPSQRRAMLEERAHSYLGSVAAALRPSTQAASAGAGRIGEREIEWLRLAFDRVIVDLALDPASGEVLALRYCGVGGPRACYGQVERRYEGFQVEDGVRVPVGYAVWFDGALQPGEQVRFQGVEMDPGADGVVE